MTTVIDLDQDQVAPSAPRRRWTHRWRAVRYDATLAWLLVAAACAVGGLGWYQALAPTTPAGVVAPTTHEVRLEVIGNGRASYAAVIDGGAVERIATSEVRTVRAGAVVVLTIVATGEGITQCRITVDGVAGRPESAAAGLPATCVHRVG